MDYLSIMARIRETTCTLCEQCIFACETAALKHVFNKIIFHEDLCIYCEQCYYVCPVAQSGDY